MIVVSSSCKLHLKTSIVGFLTGGVQGEGVTGEP